MNRPENERIPFGEAPGPGDAAQALGGKKKLRWAVISLGIAALSIWAVLSQWKGFSPRRMLEYISGANWRWLALAFLAMLGFIGFEGMAVRCACRALGYDTTRRKGFGYAAADIYFSAITPSASGGQPACAFLMMRDGIPGIVATAVLLITLMMYALSILVIGVLCMILAPRVLAGFSGVSIALILLGLVVQVALAGFFLLLIRSEQLLERICHGALKLLHRLRLLRDEEQRWEKLAASMQEYRRCAALLTGHRKMLIQSFLFNLLQRASQIAVSMLVFLAMGGRPGQAGNVFAMQSFVVLGSNCAPIPGAMGVADFLMLDGFSAILGSDQVFSMELLSRSISFYSCVLLCGVVTLVLFMRKRRAK